MTTTDPEVHLTIRRRADGWWVITTFPETPECVVVAPDLAGGLIWFSEWLGAGHNFDALAKQQQEQPQ